MAAAIVNCRLSKGHAEIRLPSGGALLSTGGADSLLAALERCGLEQTGLFGKPLEQSAQVHAIIFEALPEPLDKEAEPVPNEAAAVEGAGDDSSRSTDSTSLDAVLEKMGQMPQLLIGFASGSVAPAESCVFAACDMVFATSTTTFQLLHCEPSAPLALAPLAMLRRLGPRVLEHLSSDGSGNISAAMARSLGFVSELSEGDIELRARLGDLSSRFQRSPASAIASLKWLQRRTCRSGHASGSGADTRAAPMPDAARGTKRSAECWVPTPVKRIKVARESEEGFHQRCEMVASALQGSRDHRLPAATCKLLAEVISSSATQGPEKRGDFEKSIVDMVHAALSGIEAQLQQLVREAAAMLEGAEGERVIRDGTLLQVESKLVSTRQRAIELRAAVASNNDALRDAIQGLTDAVEAQESGDSRYKELSEEKLKLEALERDVYEPTKLGVFAKAKANKNAKDLMLLGKKYSFDESLLIGLPGALTKKPDDRSSFDTMVLSAFESQIETKIAEADMSMAQEMPGREARAAVVQSARSSHEAVKDRHTATHAELTAAQVLLKEGEGHVRAAQGLVQCFGREVQRVVTAKELAELKLTSFREGPLAAFDDLRRGSAETHAVIIPEGTAPPAEEAAESAAPDADASDDAPMTTQVDSVEAETQPEETASLQPAGEADGERPAASNEESAEEAEPSDAGEAGANNAAEEAKPATEVDKPEQASDDDAGEEAKSAAAADGPEDAGDEEEKEAVAKDAQEEDDPMEEESVNEEPKAADESPDDEDDYA